MAGDDMAGKTLLQLHEAKVRRATILEAALSNVHGGSATTGDTCGQRDRIDGGVEAVGPMWWGSDTLYEWTVEVDELTASTAVS